MKLGFIGIGEIAFAVIKGLCASKIENTIINLSPRNENRSKQLVKLFSNLNRLESNQHVLDNSDIIFLSVRPNDSKDIISKLNFKVTHTVVSFIPFLRYSELTKAVAPAKTISRAIPLPTVVNHNCPIPILNSNKTINKILGYIGEPLLINDENQLHILWTLTGFITSFYDLINELSQWATSKGVDKTDADKYLVDMFQSVMFSTQKTYPIDLTKLAKQAATPKGMNEQVAKEIQESNSHKAFVSAAENLFKQFIK